MTASAVRRRRSAFAAGLATLAMALGLAAIPAQAAPAQEQLDYVALGDSYAAGQGAAPYTDPACFVSRRGYPVIADNLRGVQLTANTACSGQKVSDVVADALVSVQTGTEIVTVTVGGNDLDSIGVLMACVPAPASFECEAAKANAIAKLTDGSLATGLAKVVGAIKYKSPTAKVVFTGYPILFDPAHPFAAVANPLAGVLNQVIAGVAGGTGSQYVDVAGAFTGHGIGSADPWISYNPANPLDPANFHPNGEGYRLGYFASLVGQRAFVLTAP
jgi:lysophospholipase L1-like esterase